MTHADLFIRLMAEHADISIDEARFIFEDFRSKVPGPEYLDRELNDKEADIMINLYRRDRAVMQLISQVMKAYGRRPLPSV